MTSHQIALNSQDEERDIVIPDFHDKEHEQNDNWEWSEAFTEFVAEKIEGFSLKVCTGLQPIADVNLDSKDLRKVAESDNATFSVEEFTHTSERPEHACEAIADWAGDNIIYGKVTPDNTSDASLYNGYTCHGDMYSLPFEDNTFDTTITDPPWKSISENNRKQLFSEITRVTKPDGKIIYNATWIPEESQTVRQFDLRFREQRDAWGGPSFLACYRRYASELTELFRAHDYEQRERYPEDCPFWGEPYPPQALSLEHNTDPKLIATLGDGMNYRCPMCGCSSLGQLQEEYFENSEGKYTTYECHDCQYRAEKSEVEELATALETAVKQQGVPLDELEEIEYTPDCIEMQLQRCLGQENPDPVFSPDLPWVPKSQYYYATGELSIPDINYRLGETTTFEILTIIEDLPSIKEQYDGDLRRMPKRELKSRVENYARAIKHKRLNMNVRDNNEKQTESTDLTNFPQPTPTNHTKQTSAD